MHTGLMRCLSLEDDANIDLFLVGVIILVFLLLLSLFVLFSSLHGACFLYR